MKYKVALKRSEEGFSVSVPGLPGCWSQGATEAEALASIREAISEYLAVRDDMLRGTEVPEVEVARTVPKVPGVRWSQNHHYPSP
ncbi:MAG TPA: type II toxin-antitoxin system HicB family antitoxin [Gemmatimonadales bacterium]|jgi:predicted RNase H-like HicB family nuclease|nr:type II toxin-antitoxin system HicB family antitoxin [Gemmatimonadales bacterium]